MKYNKRFTQKVLFFTFSIFEKTHPCISSVKFNVIIIISYFWLIKFDTNLRNTKNMFWSKTFYFWFKKFVESNIRPSNEKYQNFIKSQFSAQSSTQFTAHILCNIKWFSLSNDMQSSLLYDKSTDKHDHTSYFILDMKKHYVKDVRNLLRQIETTVNQFFIIEPYLTIP